MNGKVKVLLVAIILSVLVLGCTSPAQNAVKAGDTVSMDYTGKYVNGTVFVTTNATVAKENDIYDIATSYTPYSFIAGSGGAFIKALDDSVIGMKVNETKNITVTPETGFGEYNVSNVKTVQLETLRSNNTNLSLYVGQKISYNDESIYVAAVGPDNHTAQIVPLSNISRYTPYTINVNNNGTATLDYNYPQAGKTLYYEITVLNITKSK